MDGIISPIELSSYALDSSQLRPSLASTSWTASLTLSNEYVANDSRTKDPQIPLTGVSRWKKGVPRSPQLLLAVFHTCPKEGTGAAGAEAARGGKRL